MAAAPNLLLRIERARTHHAHAPFTTIIVGPLQSSQSSQAGYPSSSASSSSTMSVSSVSLAPSMHAGSSARAGSPQPRSEQSLGLTSLSGPQQHVSRKVQLKRKTLIPTYYSKSAVLPPRGGQGSPARSHEGPTTPRTGFGIRCSAATRRPRWSGCWSPSRPKGSGVEGTKGSQPWMSDMDPHSRRVAAVVAPTSNAASHVPPRAWLADHPRSSR